MIELKTTKKWLFVIGALLLCFTNSMFGFGGGNTMTAWLLVPFECSLPCFHIVDRSVRQSFPMAQRRSAFAGCHCCMCDYAGKVQDHRC